MYVETQKTEGTQGHVTTDTKVRVTQLQAKESKGLLVNSTSLGGALHNVFPFSRGPVCPLHTFK